MLYGCAAGTLSPEDFDSYRPDHHRLLMQAVDFERRIVRDICVLHTGLCSR